MSVESEEMMPVITSRQNAQVRALRAALTGGGAAANTVGIESPHLLREAMAANLTVKAVFVRPDRTAVLDSVPPQVSRFVLSQEVFDSAAATEASQGLAALVQRPVWHFSPEAGQLLLLLDGVQDPGNVGTLVRSAEAFGVAAVFCTPGTADAWNGKALRASAGACFRMPVLPWTAGLRDVLSDLRVPLLASVPVAEGAVRLEQLALHNGCVLAIGSEGRGISDTLLKAADYRVTLPMRGQTESLNAAVAGSILLYEAARLRSDTAGVR